MIANLMLFAKPPALELQRVDLAVLIHQIVDELHAAANQQDTPILRQVTEPLPEMRADPVQLKVALKAICTNALEAVGLGGHVQIEALAEPAEQTAREVVVRIRDTGPGVSAQVRRHLFDPFFSGREAGRGLGFGLAKAWRIVTEHGGSISVESELGTGATFVVRLPTGLTH